MDAAVGSHQGRQRVGVCAAEFFDLAIAQEDRDDLVIVGHLLQRVGVGRGTGLRLLDRREPEVFEQDLAQLRGRVDVELLAGHRVDLGLEPAALVAQFLAEVVEELDVDANAGFLHARQHRNERAFDALVEIDQFAGLQRLGEDVGQPFQHRDAAPGFLGARFAVEVERARFLIGRGQLEREMAQRKVFEEVLPFARVEQVRHDCGVLVERVQFEIEPVRHLLGAVHHERRALGSGQRRGSASRTFASARRSPSM